MAATKKVAHKNIAFMSEDEFHEFLERCRLGGLSAAEIDAIIEQDSKELMETLDFIETHQEVLRNIFSKNLEKYVDKPKKV